MVRVFLCRGDGNEQNLNLYFTKIFIDMCEAGIPIIGFIYVPDEGCYILGERECFQQVFKGTATIEDFDYDNFLENLSDNTLLFTTELDVEDPMKSKLLKWVK